MLLIVTQSSPGSALFQYCFARQLAERWGYAWRIGSLPCGVHPQRSDGGEEIFGPVEIWDGQWPTEAYSGRMIGKQELFLEPGCRIELWGSFQRRDLIEAASERIERDWLNLPDIQKRPCDDFVICLTGYKDMEILWDEDRKPDDTLIEASGLTDDEVRHLVKMVPHKRLFLIVDAPVNPQLERLRDLNAEIVFWTGTDTFLFIRSFQKIAISQSATQWWAAFLSEAREVYFPPIDRGIWSHPEPPTRIDAPWHHGIDLRVDEERYIYDWMK
jgi:hypothetical protein